MNNQNKKKPVCCFCGKECENIWGNNPYPASTNKNDRCCDYCNTVIVIPKRIDELMKKKDEWKV